MTHSHTNAVKLLPTLPPKWSEGSVRGLGIRGGFKLDMKWKDSNWTDVKIISACGGEFRLYCKDNISVFDKDGGSVKVERNENVVSWKCKKNGEYKVVRI